MNRLDKIRAQHAEHDMSDSDEAYLLGRVAALEVALEKYGSHIGNCKWGDAYPTGRPHPCTCGLLADCPHCGEPAALTPAQRD